MTGNSPGVGVVVELSLLGPFEVRHAGVPVVFDTAKARMLVAWLALESPRPVSRTRIATLFWPDHPPSNAATNLRQTLARVRRALPPSAGEAIVSGPELRLAPGAFEIDAVRFGALLNECDTHAHTNGQTCAVCFARRQQAVALYRGPLLDGTAAEIGDEFEDWVKPRRRDLELRVLEALGILADQHRLAGEFELMRQVAMRQVSIDPWRERAHRQVMCASYLAGNRAAAIAYFRELEQHLAEELDTEPDRETWVLYRQIVNGVVLPEPQPGPARNRSTPLRVSPGAVFIGRDAELAGLTNLVRGTANRLVTVTGPGGVGKTRLALQAAATLHDVFRDGVVTVPLSAIRDPDHVGYAIADALDLRVASQGTLRARLAEYLGDRRILLVLDNFEHVLPAASFVSDLLTGCDGLAVLVTSRKALRLSMERQYRLNPMALPEPGVTDPVVIADVDAARLFISRVNDQMPGFRLDATNAGTVAALCHRLDGLPLALELAAARLATIKPDALLERITTSLPLLTGGPRDAPPRHRTMHAAIAWSYDLLAESEQCLFRMLAVFPGGVTLDRLERFLALSTIDTGGAALDHLQSLVSSSLVMREDPPDRPPRYRMLDVIREFAEERLRESGSFDTCWRAHADLLIETFDDRPVTPFAPDDPRWYADASAEHANLHDVLACLRASRDTVRHARLAGVLAWYWFLRGNAGEGQTILEYSMRHREFVPPEHASGMAAVLGTLRLMAGDVEGAAALLRAELARAEAGGNVIGQAQLHIVLGVQATLRRAYEESRAHHERALALLETREQSPLVLAIASASRANMGVAAREQGELAKAEALHLAALAGQRATGALRGEMHSLIDLGDVARERHDLDRALRYYQEAITTAEGHEDRRFVVTGIRMIGELAADSGRYREAAQLLAGTERWQQRYGNMARIARPYVVPESPENLLRDRLGDETLAELRHAGQAMSFDELREMALTAEYG